MKLTLTKHEFAILKAYTASIYTNQYLCYRIDNVLNVKQGMTKERCRSLLARLRCCMISRQDIRFINQFTIICGSGSQFYIEYINSTHRKICNISSQK